MTQLLPDINDRSAPPGTVGNGHDAGRNERQLTGTTNQAIGLPESGHWRPTPDAALEPLAAA